ncbi:MAG: hypothetical protein QHH19_02090 [Candidatus Thermoplasmatota archaeon]|jgi:hypothetical protein|nr:hypothetical protein [Candidatus Thermoplasmatota archaeon]
MKKNIIFFIAVLLISSSLISGCTQQGLAVTVVPQNIGDEVAHTLKMRMTATEGSSPSTTHTINGTIFTKVNGTKTILDGFGIEREAIEMYTKTTFEMNQQQYLGYNMSAYTLSYLDPESKSPIKTVSKTVSNINMGIMAMSFEFYVSKIMYDFLYSFFGFSVSAVSDLTPNDISSAFEGKNIKKGDKGTITIANMPITWTALSNENIKNYDCMKIQFSLPINTSSQEGMTTSITCNYIVWLASSFPSLIKMSGTITSVTTITFGNYQTSIIMDILLESSKRGTTPISWGSSKPVFPERNLFGEYLEWSIMPDFGNKTSTISFTPEEALNYAQINSPDLTSYLNSHPNAYIASCKYGRTDNNETWELSFRDETTLGYDIKLSYDGIEKTILSEESKTYLTSGSLKSSLSQELLTFSGCENIFSKYVGMVSSNMLIQFVSDISSQLSSLDSAGGFLSGMFEMFPDSMSMYMIAFGDTATELPQNVRVAIIDVESGQVIMLITMPMYGFGGL